MGKKSLQSQSSYYSALILSLHCTPLLGIILSQPHPAGLSHSGTSGCLTIVPLDVLYEGRRHCTRWYLQARPALGLGLGALI